MMLAWIALVLYFAAGALLVASFARRSDGLQRLAPGALTVGAALHAVGIALRSIELGHFAVTPLAEGLSFVGWALVAIFLVLHWRYRVSVVGAVIVPIAFFLTLGGALGSSGSGDLPPVLRSAWLPVHVVLAFLGHAVLALACVASILYLFEDRRLKEKRPPRLGRFFPSLEKLDDLNHRLLVWGFPLLTLGILTGAVWAHVAWGAFWSWDPRETWSLLTWLLYAGLLHGRIAGGWRGRTAAALTIVGFGFVVVSFVSVNFFFPGRHGGDFGS